MIEEFQNILFPQHIGFSASKSIERYAEIQNFLSGREQRNSRKYHSKRKYTIGVAAKNFADLALVTDFYEARRGPLIGFKWSDILDFKSCAIDDEIDANDQEIGIYDGSTLDFQLMKSYGENTDDEQNYLRKITKPRPSSLRIAADGVELNATKFFVDPLNGVVSISSTAGLNNGDEISAGYEFDVAVRFADMQLQIDYKTFKAGEITQIPLIEILD